MKNNFFHPRALHSTTNTTIERASAGPEGLAIAPPQNRTGLPDELKAGVENLSGLSLDDVRVHYNSSKPAALQALAYTQGTDIHVAPGQERHLPHEAWHVVQQAPLFTGSLIGNEQQSNGAIPIQCEKASGTLTTQNPMDHAVNLVRGNFDEEFRYELDIPEQGISLADLSTRLNLAEILSAKFAWDDDTHKIVHYGRHDISVRLPGQEVGQVHIRLEAKRDTDDVHREYSAGKACVLQALVNLPGNHLPATTAEDMHDLIWESGSKLVKYRNYDDDDVYPRLYQHYGVHVHESNVNEQINAIKTRQTVPDGRYIFSTGPQGQIGHMVVAVKSNSNITYVQDPTNSKTISGTTYVQTIFKKK